MSALEELVRVLEPPVMFLARHPSGIGRTVLPVDAIQERIDRLLSSAGAEPIEEPLRELKMLLGTLAWQRGGEAKVAETQRALERIASLLQRLKEQRESEGVNYRPTDRPLTGMLEILRTSVQYVKGVGPRRAELLNRMGINTVEDLLYHLPFRYEDRRQMRRIGDLCAGEEATIVGRIAEASEWRRRGSWQKVLRLILEDDSGSLPLLWYHQIAYFRSRYRPGQRVLVHGKVESQRKSAAALWRGGPSQRCALRMIHPQIELLSQDDSVEAGKLVAVYHKPTQMSVSMMRRIVGAAVEGFLHYVPSALPEDLARRRAVMPLAQALQELHQPCADADLGELNRAASRAHRSVVYDELFFLQLGLALRRRALGEQPGIAFRVPSPRAADLVAKLPFELTRAQRRVLAEIERDMGARRPMNRLVQGDVGSGKTVVALLAAMVAIDSGYQAALMVPTELLAEQHCHTLRCLGSLVGLRVALLTGEVRGRARARMERALARGDIDLVVGTHALIQQGVEFRKLGLVIIDEQHRFGVVQRAQLRRHGENPDTLLLTATPIPRTLALTVYGDLDISSLDELPPGRKPVVTRVFSESRRGQVYEFVKRELDAGRQAYIVCPLVEESEQQSLRSARSHAEELSEGILRDYRVGLVHGRMQGEEKERVMRRFKEGELQCLVSTTVIEVGIDVPNASVMVVEHAERFGLAQLHQLRGRVGRGQARSICFLLTGWAKGEEARRRLEVMEQTNDGFRIAEEDLVLRGPGEFLGTRQSGLPDFRVANIIRDAALLAAAKADALEWLSRKELSGSRAAERVWAVLESRWAGRLELAHVG